MRWYSPPFAHQQLEKDIHATQQKLGVFLSKWSGAERLAARPRSDGLPTRPISTRWISIFWALTQRRVSVAVVVEMIDIVKQFASERSEDVLKGVALDVLERGSLCREVNGGHFQHLKKKRSKKNKRVKVS